MGQRPKGMTIWVNFKQSNHHLSLHFYTDNRAKMFNSSLHFYTENTAKISNIVACHILEGSKMIEGCEDLGRTKVVLPHCTRASNSKSVECIIGFLHGISTGLDNTIFIDREAREIIRLVVSVRPSV